MSAKSLKARLSWISALETFLDLESFTLLAHDLGVTSNTARIKVFNAIKLLGVDCKTKSEILRHKDWLPVRINDWKDMYLTEDDPNESYSRGLFVDKYIAVRKSLGYQNNLHVMTIGFALYDAGARFK